MKLWAVITNQWSSIIGSATKPMALRIANNGRQIGRPATEEEVHEWPGTMEDWQQFQEELEESADNRIEELNSALDEYNRQVEACNKFYEDEQKIITESWLK